MRFYYTYILRSKKDYRYYSGYSADLGNRLKEHRDGKVISTRSRLPIELIYYEACLNKEDALRRERYFKSGKGKKFINKRLRRFLKCTGFAPVTGTP